ncbi:MAG TPA: hypothetical protein VKV03_16170 [Candidatus Binataceae bacterium]|nr:hypothetical protein [Candidatus Binataceae bacterium]
MLIDNPKGGFSFVKGIGPFSSGALANAGSEIVHAVAIPLIKLDDGYGVIERHLRDVGRPLNAVCGMELRIPKPLTLTGFDEFNRGYLKRLAAWDIHLDGNNPIARTNVAIEISPVAEPALFGFYYTVPSSNRSRTFVLAGAGEVKSMSGANIEVVAGADLSPSGLVQKTKFVMDLLASRLGEMKMTWADATAVNLYTVHDANSVVASTILPALGLAAHRGITWHYTRPPIDVMQLEIDAHAVVREIVISRG